MKCQACGKDAYMGFTCKRCGGYFCTKDRLPENHNCAFRNMKSDEIQVRMQLENNRSSSRFERPLPNETSSFNERRNYPNYPGNQGPRDFDDEEDANSGRFIARTPMMNWMFYLLLFVIFAVMDFIFLLNYPTIWMALPLIVHGVFLPFLFYIAYKQRRRELPPKGFVTFIQLIIVYMVVYMIAEIIVAISMRNYVMIGIYITIGVCMVVVWSRVLQQMKYVFGRQK
ncbi:MAG TPA: AN1-type zinc finger domain-containing protein [Candidatus Lokiarchaeia archaeon]|nr:AN1-type zinc finger domain-containing protein [Candidatus Lokiarchaeia archaeon]